MSEYEAQAEAFLSRNNLEIKAAHKADRCPPWCGEDGQGCVHGDRYRVTIKRKDQRGGISFDFWNSLHDVQNGDPLSSYSVLACISGDAYCPETFEDFCGDYGYDEDSRKALSTFSCLRKFAEKLQAFLTADEIEQLAEIN